jgi:hypothetical protein
MHETAKICRKTAVLWKCAALGDNHCSFKRGYLGVRLERDRGSVARSVPVLFQRGQYDSNYLRKFMPQDGALPWGTFISYHLGPAPVGLK